MEALEAHEDLEDVRDGLRHRHPHTGGDGDPRGPSQKLWRAGVQHSILRAEYLIWREKSGCFYACILRVFLHQYGTVRYASSSVIYHIIFFRCPTEYGCVMDA